jgi:hypothetical protein
LYIFGSWDPRAPTEVSDRHTRTRWSKASLHESNIVVLFEKLGYAFLQILSEIRGKGQRLVAALDDS